MLKLLVKGLFGRVLSYAAFTLGFWLLFQGFSRPAPGLAVVGGAVVLLGMYLMVQARRSDPGHGPVVDERGAPDSAVSDKSSTTGDK